MTRPDGSTQLTFDGMPLYLYASDSAAGQANGQGLGGVWFAMKATGTKPAGGGGGGGGCGGYGGYGS